MRTIADNEFVKVIDLLAGDKKEYIRNYVGEKILDPMDKGAKWRPDLPLQIPSILRIFANTMEMEIIELVPYSKFHDYGGKWSHMERGFVVKRKTKSVEYVDLLRVNKLIAFVQEHSATLKNAHDVWNTLKEIGQKE